MGEEPTTTHARGPHDGLRRASAHGAALVLSSLVLRIVINLGGTAVLARLIAKEDFGVVAMAMALVSLASIVNGLGLASATVQAPEIDGPRLSNLFWIGIGSSLGFIAVIAAVAPTYAAFMGEPRVAWILVAASSGLLLNAAAQQHYALLERRLRFRATVTIHLTSLLLGLGVGLGLAFAEAGAWALVAQGLTTNLVVMIGSWALVGWLPSLPSHAPGTRRLVAFGLRVTTAELTNGVSSNATSMMVGRFEGATPLAVFSKSNAIVYLATRQLSAPLSGVVFPVLSRLQHDEDGFRRFYLRAVALPPLVGVPVVAFCMLEAPSVVRTLLGPQWDDAARILLLLGPGALAGTMSAAADWLALPLGRPKLLVVRSIVAGISSIAAVGIGLQWGIHGAAIALSISNIAQAVWVLSYVCRGSPVRAGQVWGSAVRPAIASAAGVGLAFTSSRLLDLPPVGPLRLALTFPPFLLGCAAGWLAIPGGLDRLRWYASLGRSIVRKEVPPPTP